MSETPESVQIGEQSIQLGDQETIATIEQALALAKEGKIVGVGIIGTISPGQCTILVSGRNASGIHIGASQLQRMALEQMFPTKAPSSLVLPK